MAALPAAKPTGSRAAALRRSAAGPPSSLSLMPDSLSPPASPSLAPLTEPERAAAAAAVSLASDAVGTSCLPDGAEPAEIVFHRLVYGGVLGESGEVLRWESSPQSSRTAASRSQLIARPHC